MNQKLSRLPNYSDGVMVSVVVVALDDAKTVGRNYSLKTKTVTALQISEKFRGSRHCSHALLLSLRT
jgi:hypothetical protein